MKEIQVKFVRHGNVVCARILGMPEELRNTGVIEVGEVYKINSMNRPEICRTDLFLCGYDTKEDNIWSCYQYATNEDAEKAVTSFQALINKWNVEHKEILDDVEKEYLSAVIKPFKNSIKHIKKVRQTQEDFEYILLGVNSIKKDAYEEVLFPFFEAGKMYKGMEVGTAYSLKGLGLE